LLGTTHGSWAGDINSFGASSLHLAARRVVMRAQFMLCLNTLRRLATEDDGQDLIEYALLSAFIGLAGVAVFSGIGATIQASYSSWLAGADAAVEMPDPVTP
jgi:Flp pilus assembly pilin Flp